MQHSWSGACQGRRARVGRKLPRACHRGLYVLDRYVDMVGRTGFERARPSTSICGLHLRDSVHAFLRGRRIARRPWPSPVQSCAACPVFRKGVQTGIFGRRLYPGRLDAFAGDAEPSDLIRSPLDDEVLNAFPAFLAPQRALTTPIGLVGLRRSPDRQNDQRYDR